MAENDSDKNRFQWKEGDVIVLLPGEKVLIDYNGQDGIFIKKRDGNVVPYDREKAIAEQVEFFKDMDLPLGDERKDSK